MKSRIYKVAGAFSSMPFLGNTVAAVLDAEGLDTAGMQAIAC
ncbi:PhzF family phenazine biosynthesis protein [Plastoroseomonas arctica]|nr:PhzF family phenazine biosynthesis protein [Plastoroseomonas arctica]